MHFLWEKNLAFNLISTLLLRVQFVTISQHPLVWVMAWHQTSNKPLLEPILTHRGRGKMAAIFQTTFSNAFSWIQMFVFRLTFVPKGPINNIPVLVQIMAWRRPGDKPLSETVLVSLLTHICVTQPQWVNKTLVWVIYMYISISDNNEIDDIFQHKCK